MTWFGKASCRERAACTACRTKLTFRESLFRAGLVDSADFACPHGYSADRLPMGLGDVVEKVASALGFKPCGGCRKRKRKWNRVRVR